MSDIKQTGNTPPVWPGQAVTPVGGAKQSPQRKQRTEQQKKSGSEDDDASSNASDKDGNGIDEYA